MSESTTESPDWLRRYRDEYLTLDEVGELEGITREGVRQRLKRLGIEPRSLAETRRLRERHETSMQAEAIRRAFLRTRSWEDTAEQVGLQVSWVQRFVKDHVPDPEVLVRVPRNRAKNYTEEDLFGSLREAASLSPGNLTAAAYEAFVETHETLPDGRPRPGKQAMALRYGFWRLALEAAGLPANFHPGPKKEFDAVDAVDAVVECWRKTGRPPTVAGYEKWQQEHGGYPSASTVRKLADSWDTLRVRAWQVVHGIVLDQDDPDVTVPESLLAGGDELPASDAFVTYYAANEGTEVSLRSDLVADGYVALERAVQSHAQIQNVVAQAATEIGLRPWSPALAGPAFDVALSHGDEHVFVVEVKSATAENLEFQLRIGLGQVLRYAHQLRSDTYTVHPVLAIELHPDDSWVSLLQDLGVGLLVRDSIPEDLAKLMEDTLDDGEPGELDKETAAQYSAM